MQQIKTRMSGGMGNGVHGGSELTNQNCKARSEKGNRKSFRVAQFSQEDNPKRRTLGEKGDGVWWQIDDDWGSIANDWKFNNAPDWSVIGIIAKQITI